MGLKEDLEGVGSDKLRDLVRNNDRAKEEAIKAAKEILEERDAGSLNQEQKEEKEVFSIRDKLGKLIEKVDQGEDNNQWKHKIISGPVLGRQDELEEKLDNLGEDGWELVDTQRHSVMAKQHAVCFLKKKKSSG